jgi:hypothetical protein
MYKTRITAVLGSVAILAVTACAGSAHQAAGNAHLAASAHPAQGTTAPAPQVTDHSGQSCTALDSLGYCPGDDPAPQVTDPSGQSCNALDGNGYCPGDDPTDPNGQTCPALDSQGYCPGDDPAPAPPTTTPAGTVSEQQALIAAEQYLNIGSGFSRQGLIDQLDSSYGNGFSEADATWAVDHSDADWDAQAVEAAQGYMQLGGFSRDSLIQQLTSPYGSKFTYAQAVYAADKVGL